MKLEEEVKKFMQDKNKVWITANQYQIEAKKTAIFPANKALEYLSLGLVGEAGEVAEKVKKKFRDGEKESFKEDIKKELGDVLWYISALAGDLDITLQEIADVNKQKLQDRLARDQIHGNGDNR